MDNKFIWFLIFFILGLAVVWGIGSFIAWDMLWFIHSLVGRILGIVFFISILGASLENAYDM